MTELTIRPEEIRDAIERNVAAYSPTTAREEIGRPKTPKPQNYEKFRENMQEYENLWFISIREMECI